MNKLVIIGFLVVCIAAMAYGKSKTEEISVRNCDECQTKCTAKAKQAKSDSVTHKCTTNTNNFSDCKCTYNAKNGATSSALNWSILSLIAISAGAIQLR